MIRPVDKLKIDRLKKARDYLANKVNPKTFDMHAYRTGDNTTPECNSVGCAVGHLTVLDDKLKTDRNYFRYIDGEIKFVSWAKYFFGLSELEYAFIASGYFARAFPKYTGKQQLAHAIERIDYVRKHGRVPKGFRNFLDCIEFPLGFFKGKIK